MKFKFGDRIKNSNLKGTIVCAEFGEDLERYVICTDKPSTRYTFKNIQKLATRIPDVPCNDKEELRKAKEICGLINLGETKYCHPIISNQPDFKDFKKIGEQPLIETKFKLGDRVVTNKTGPINIGEIIGYVDLYKYYTAVTWDKLYPKCYYKPLYFIKLDKPNKNLTIDEFVKGRLYDLDTRMSSLPPNIVDIVKSNLEVNPSLLVDVTEDLKEIYYKTIPDAVSICAPEEDLSSADGGNIFDKLLE